MNGIGAIIAKINVNWIDICKIWKKLVKKLLFTLLDIHTNNIIMIVIIVIIVLKMPQNLEIWAIQTSIILLLPLFYYFIGLLSC